jgi:hypothetical protein
MSVHPRTEITHHETEDSFVQAIERAGGLFDVIVVDSKPRNLAVKQALRFITSSGIIVFDDSNWYPQVMSYMRSRPDRLLIEFHGNSPGSIHPPTTSIAFPRYFEPTVIEAHFVPPGGVRQRSEHDVLEDDDG